MKKISLIIIISVLSYGMVLSQFSRDIVSLTGTVTDINTKNPVSVTMSVFDNAGKLVVKTETNKQGFYFITELAPGKAYTMQFGGLDYFSHSFHIDIPNVQRYEEYSRDFQLIPKKKNVKVLLPVPPFELNKSKLRPGAYLFLRDYINFFINNKSVKFSIICYPDNSENSQESNMELTTKRAEVLKDFFIAHGVGENRLKAEGKRSVDKNNPPPELLRPKGKRYIGSIYLVIESY